MIKLLSICIPTYNGGENLKYNINKLIGISLKYNFDICVSDNASTDDTQEYMSKLVSKYDFIKYHRNNKNMGIAYNFNYVLKMANTKYVWFLGDDDEIYEECIEQLYNCLLVYKPDICVVNAKKNSTKIVGLKSRLYTDKNEVMSDLGRYMSWMSCLIFNRSIVDNIGINKIKDNAFPHLLGIFKFLNNRCNLYWFSNFCIDNQSIVQERYNDKVLQYFIKDWYLITIQLNDYKKEAKQKFLDSMWKEWSLRKIISLRKKNIINRNSIGEIKVFFDVLPKKLKLYIIGSSYIPLNFLNMLYFLLKKEKRSLK